MYNIYFKNISSDGFGLVTKDIGRRKRAREQIDQYNVPYRNGELIVHSGKYDSYIRPMMFTVTDSTLLPHIYDWLDGYGELRTDKDEGGFFLGSVVGEIDHTSDGPVLDELVVEFLVEPFFYLDGGDRPIELTEPTNIYNGGTIASEPIITVYGVGDVDFKVNSQSVLLEGIVDSITMDTKNKTCYKNGENAGKQMKGKYIHMDKGVNSINWTGDVTKVEIIPRWCER